MEKIQTWYNKCRQEGTVDLRYLILLFMVAVYPLIVIPHPFYIVFPLGVTPLSYFYAPRYVILILVSFLALIVLLKDRAKINHPVFIPLMFFIVFALISAFLAPVPLTAWIGNPYRFTGLSVYLGCIILFILAWQTKNTEKVLGYLIGSAVIVSFLSVLQHFGLNLVPHEAYREGYVSYGTMANADFLGTYAAFILPAAILFFLRYKKIFWLISVAFIHAGLMVSTMWGEWLVIMVALVIIAWYALKEKGKRKAFVQVFVVLAVVTCFFFSVGKKEAIIKRAAVIPTEALSSLRLEDKAGSGRIFIWRHTLNIIPHVWAFGLGPDHLIYAGIKFGEKTPVDKAHNVYLEIAVTMGLFALLAYLVFLSFFLRPGPNETGFVLWLMILVYLVQGLFNIDVVMIMPLFWIVLGMSLSPGRK